MDELTYTNSMIQEIKELLSGARRFYQSYPIQQTASVKLSWLHYCELLTISDEDKRCFYEKETINSGWSVREMKRQIATSLYERLLLSDDKANKEKVLALAEKGIEIKDAVNGSPFYSIFFRPSNIAVFNFPEKYIFCFSVMRTAKAFPKRRRKSLPLCRWST